MSSKKKHPGPWGGYAVKHMIEAVEEKMAAGEPIGAPDTPARTRDGRNAPQE